MATRSVNPKRGGLVGSPMESVPLPLWREPSAVLEWMRLRMSSIYSGRTVARGDGAPVILVPGFLCNDLALHSLNGWLERVGYDSRLSEIGINAGCLDVLGNALVARVEGINAETGRRVHIVGHSLGGLLARCAAAIRPELVASVVALGSPFQQIRSHRLIVAAARGIGAVRRNLPGAEPRCLTPRCGCATVQAAADYPDHVPFTSVFTRADGVVDWEACRTGEAAQDVEVGGSHIGLLFNRDAYRAIAAHLGRTSTAARAAA